MHKPAQVELQLDRPQLPYSETLGPTIVGGSPARYRRRQPNPIRKGPHTLSVVILNFGHASQRFDGFDVLDVISRGPMDLKFGRASQRSNDLKFRPASQRSNGFEFGRASQRSDGLILDMLPKGPLKLNLDVLPRGLIV